MNDDRSERVQRALYRIADAASAAEDLGAFYRRIHDIVAELMYATNFFIALYDAERGAIKLPVLRRRGRRRYAGPIAVGVVRGGQRPWLHGASSCGPGMTQHIDRERSAVLTGGG